MSHGRSFVRLRQRLDRYSNHAFLGAAEQRKGATPEVEGGRALPIARVVMNESRNKARGRRQGNDNQAGTLAWRGRSEHGGASRERHHAPASDTGARR